jgi:hypothetical protein
MGDMVEAWIVAVFGSERDRVHAAPGARLLLPLAAGSVHARPGLLARAAAFGLAVGAVSAPILAWAESWLAGRTLSSSATVLLGAVAGALGAALAAAFAARSARSFERQVNDQLRRGWILVLVETSREAAPSSAVALERDGALEATPLPPDLDLGTATSGPVLPFDRFHGGATEGATLISGSPLLATRVRRLDGEGVRLALFGRDGHAGPVHSSSGGPASVHAVAPSAGFGWWRRSVVRLGGPERVRLPDGELVILGEGASRLARALSGHATDTVRSALARVAEAYGCADFSAEEVIDRIDSGSTGLVLFGALEARRHAVERLSEAATASAEGRATRTGEVELPL